MGRRIRDDFDGVVQAWEYGKDGRTIGGAYTLAAGAAVPEEVSVPEHLLEPVDGAPVETGRGAFDPSARNVNEVNLYLDGVSDEERARVLALEVEGHGRKGLLDGPYSQFVPAPKKTPAKKDGE